MSGPRRVSLKGFEEDLATFLVAEFEFTTVPSGLVGGRNLFVQDMPEDEDILQTSPDFNAEAEPVVAIFTNPGPGLLPSSSSGSRHEWNLRFVVRYGVNPETAKELMEELVKFVEDGARGLMTSKFMVKGAIISIRPTLFARLADGHAFSSCVIRFLAVPLPE